MKRLINDYGDWTEEGHKVFQETKHMFEQINKFIEDNQNNYPMKELEDLLKTEIMISCTVARQKAKRDYLISNKQEK